MNAALTPAQIPELITCVGPGWYRLLTELHAELVAVAPTYRVIQLKEKFGRLRVYVTAPDEVFEQVNALISMAEDTSATTCEFCGKPGTQTGRLGWIKTLCDDCPTGAGGS